MGIRPVEMSGMIQRTGDVATQRQQEESRPQMQQQHIQTELSRESIRHMEQVQEQQNAEEKKKRYDAREKGSNEYQDNRKKGQKKKQKKENCIVKKNREESHGFDVKI